jgi:hypothetical protein
MDPLSAKSQYAFDLARLHSWMSQDHYVDGHRIGNDKIHRLILYGEFGVLANQEGMPLQGELF